MMGSEKNLRPVLEVMTALPHTTTARVLGQQLTSLRPHDLLYDLLNGPDDLFNNQSYKMVRNSNPVSFKEEINYLKVKAAKCSSLTTWPGTEQSYPFFPLKHLLTGIKRTSWKEKATSLFVVQQRSCLTTRQMVLLQFVTCGAQGCCQVPGNSYKAAGSPRPILPCAWFCYSGFSIL